MDTMRFNSKELSYIAQHADRFDKEGVLLMKEKVDGLFKKGSVYQERYFRLKGNLLFYFKHKEQTKVEPLGVFILERCTVELDLKEDIANSFMLVFEGEEHPFFLATLSEDDRDSWIQALHIASYECLKMQLQQLREQVQARTGRDPIQLPKEPVGLDLDSETDHSEDPVLEISLSCNDLPTDSNGQPPNTLIILHTITPPDQQLWIHHNHTEIVEKSCNPQFLKTVGFGNKDSVDTATRVKLTVYHVVERMTWTMFQVGQAVFTLQDVLMNPSSTLTLTLQGSDMKEYGQVTITCWVNDSDFMKESSDSSLKSRGSFTRNSTVLKIYHESVINRSFRFTTNVVDKVLLVHEYMAESRWSFVIPSLLLKLWIDEEKKKVSLLQDFGEISPTWSSLRQEMTDYCMSSISTYTQKVAHLSSYTGPSFKPSCEKDNKELEFIPTNLHLARMCVTSEGSSEATVYDIMTVGAFVAYTQKFRSGGLRKMLQGQREFHSSQSTLGFKTKIQSSCSLLNDINKLKAEVTEGCKQLHQSALQGSDVSLQTATKDLTEVVRELIRLCDDPLLQLSAEKYMLAKSPSNASDGLDVVASLGPVSKSFHGRQAKSPEKAWKWSGSSFVKSPTVEPWEVTRLNLEAALMCLISKVDEFSKDSTSDEAVWQSDLNPIIINLQDFVEIVSTRAALFLSFLSLVPHHTSQVNSWSCQTTPILIPLHMENKDHIKLNHMIKYRRDIVASQAITSLVAGLSITMQTRITDEAFLEQISKIGFLIGFEALLSCYGDEMGMLEDMSVAVDDLAFVFIKFEEEVDGQCEPTITALSDVKAGEFPDINRHSICVSLPLPKTSFSKLPENLQKNKIKITPVFFNIGINEQATLAEKFGNTSTQERINAESIAKVFNYYEDYVRHFGEPENKSGPGSVNNLTKQLHTNIMTKKSKNTEVLHIAAEVCRKLKGIRFISCKSGKDRTSMAVTLEMVQILQHEHDLASHVFLHALDCLRSVGCRRENPLKNAGVRKYAFNSLQLLYIPRLYRPPSGTYGNTQT
ncbi:inositol polyphosphate-4-phosphatase type I A-like isoform X1 [Gigantopelta aegis]|uniref:inositol polyphosphate-4-phosphatase type I A-like isoform X1 n=1 Tax=Gigantopelta aegis TaxID=1735272 RepID=UPI001B88A3FA|nr:inositol polyphosphate-4-phosphatase type I A-like isoform X1 [Gigantopelta aegis]XP_041359842.1 inositol polyphosphate-4-phosphatase type I A-like isoform X1 [Gigantopelta aegis]